MTGSAERLDSIFERGKSWLEPAEVTIVKTLLRRGRFLVNRQAHAHHDLSFDRAEADALLAVLEVYVDEDGANDDGDQPPIHGDEDPIGPPRLDYEYDGSPGPGYEHDPE